MDQARLAQTADGFVHVVLIHKVKLLNHAHECTTKTKETRNQESFERAGLKINRIHHHRRDIAEAGRNAVVGLWFFGVLLVVQIGRVCSGQVISFQTPSDQLFSSWAKR